MKTTGFTDHRARLMRLIEPQVAFHVATRNHAGQSLLHTICSKDTYSVKPRVQHFFHWMYPQLPERYEQISTNNRTPGFTDELCTLLLKHGADFNAAHKAGQRSSMISLFAHLKEQRGRLCCLLDVPFTSLLCVAFLLQASFRSLVSSSVSRAVSFASAC